MDPSIPALITVLESIPNKSLVQSWDPFFVSDILVGPLFDI